MILKKLRKRKKESSPPSQPFYIHHTISNGVLIISLSGNLSNDAPETLENYLSPFVDQPDISGIIFNFKDTQFLDSAGLGIIVSTYRRLKQSERFLILCEMGDKFLQLFQLTKLQHVILNFPTLEEALNKAKE